LRQNSATHIYQTFSTHINHRSSTFQSAHRPRFQCHWLVSVPSVPMLNCLHCTRRECKRSKYFLEQIRMTHLELALTEYRYDNTSSVRHDHHQHQSDESCTRCTEQVAPNCTEDAAFERDQQHRFQGLPTAHQRQFQRFAAPRSRRRARATKTRPVLSKVTGHVHMCGK
jgi:hypothetical protein